MKPGFERLLVGRTLAGRYEVREAIGRGGMSLVFRATDRTLGRDVAVKVVALAAGPEPETLRARFRREAASAARIQHPNVVSIFDFGTDAELDLDFIVMELLRGRDLKEALHAGPLPRPEALRVLMDAARGVAAGHRANIVHRDVKPANVFLVGDGQIEAVRVLDFGIAKPLGDDADHALTTIGQLPHSPAYATPEHLSADAPVTPASDVYQLGLVGYELLAGRRAFDEDARDRIRAGAIVPLPRTDAWDDTDPAIRDVIERALQIDPSARPADASAFAEALAEAQSSADARPVAGSASLPPLPLPDPDATELLSATTGMPVIAPSLPAAPESAVADGVPVVRPGRVTARRRTPVLWIVPLVLVLAAAVWLARRGGTRDAAADESTVADTGGLAGMDEEFVRLQASATRGTSAAPATGSPRADSATGATRSASAVAQAEIEEAVHALNRDWVNGDLRAHIRHYASRVDYYNSRRLPRSGVLRDRTREMRRYEDRRIGIHSIQVQFQEEDRARVLVDKEWIFRGDDGNREGRGIQEYVFKRDDDDGKWYVISEQLLTTNEARTRPD